MENSVFARNHYPGLDALRGLAILLVLFFHYFSFPLGWIGVDLFFVLSGFLITKTLLELKSQPAYFRNFFFRRVLRIFPVYFLTLVIFYIAAPIFFSEKGPGTVYAYYTSNQVWFWTFLQNWLFIKKGVPPEPYLQHFWSLAIEEQFYLCWPFLVFCIRKKQNLRTAVAAIFFMALFVRVVLWVYSARQDAFYYNTFARVDGLAAGSYLSISLYLNKRFSKTQCWLIVAAFFILIIASYLFLGNWRYDNRIFATLGYSVSALFFAVICYWLVLSDASYRHLNLLCFFGRISYGLYVYHIPVFLLASFLIQKYAPNIYKQFNLPPYFTSIISLVAATIISVLSLKIVEQPVLKLKKRFVYAAPKMVSRS